LSFLSRRKPLYKRRRRRLPIIGILVLLVILAGALYFATRSPEGTADRSGTSDKGAPSRSGEEANSQ
jgi:hypothetical protein